jgi:hypothetical protein
VHPTLVRRKKKCMTSWIIVLKYATGCCTYFKWHTVVKSESFKEKDAAPILG